MICRNCGRENNTKNTYCSFCGYSFANYSSITNADGSNLETENKQKIVISILLFALIVILSVILAVVINFGKDDSDYSEENVIEDNTEDDTEGDEKGGFSSWFKGDEDKPENDEGNGEAPETDAVASNAISASEYCAAYKNYIESNTLEYVEAGFIDVNGDEVLELVLVGDCEAAGNVILTYSANGVDLLQTNRLYFEYIPGGNRICNSDGNSGYYYDLIYAIEDGKWVSVASGTYSEKYDNGIVLDEQGNPVYEYTWNDNEVSATTYNAELCSVFNKEESARAIISDTPASLENRLLAADATSCDFYYSYFREDKAIHRYEIIVADVSWSDAYWECCSRGGHLVHINSSEEFDYLVDMIYQNGMQEKKIWLGGRRGYPDDKYHWAAPYYDDDKYYNDCIDTIDDNPIYNSFWLAGEPSYYSEDGQGNYLDENYMQMFYSKKQERFVWNDTVNDVITVIPSYKGTIAYICEYE